MSLINRVAVSNVLNFHGDNPRKPWAPMLRYVCLDFRGQSTAVNLTNGGGKTTLCEGITGLLSRDQILISRTKSKFSPKSSKVWSHVQIELIRPLSNAGQSDFLTDQGNEINGEHWVFGMYCYNNDQAVNYYYFQGRLEDLPIGNEKGKKISLVSNEEFVATRKQISGLSMGPHEDEWADALALKANLPQSIVRQLADFQKRGGQDKSALLYEIKPRSGQTYAEVFFHKVLAPAIMEGIMDREGEEGEVSLEDSVERSVFSTVTAKQNTEAKRRETEELGESVNQLSQVMKAVDGVETKSDEFKKQLGNIQHDVQLLTELVERGTLPGILKDDFPNGFAGEVARHLVIEPGSVEPRILDKGLAALLDRQPKHINELAQRNNIEGWKSSQVIDFTCDFKLQGSTHGGRRSGKSYSLNGAKDIVNASSTIAEELTKETACEFIEDAFSWFDKVADTNIYRQLFVEHTEFIKSLRHTVEEETNKSRELQEQIAALQSRQQRMETNEGLHAAMAESGFFTDDELQAPVETGQIVEMELKNAQDAKSDFDLLNAKLEEYKANWTEFVTTFGNDAIPNDVTSQKKEQKEQLIMSRNDISRKLDELSNSLNSCRIALSKARTTLAEQKQKLDRLSEGRSHYYEFVSHFGNVSPVGAENSWRRALANAEQNEVKLLPEETKCLEGINALHRFREKISETKSPSQWLDDVHIRRNEIAVELSNANGVLSELREQRKVLNKESIAANASTRQALVKLDEYSIDYKSLHQVIDKLGLEHERRRQMLGVFSALLFAPVLETEEEAQKAAKAFEESGVQLPVFLYRSVSEYCRSGSIECVNDSLMVGTTAGIITRSVECLLEPDLVEREKGHLDSRIEKTIILIDELSSESKSISDETENVKLAIRARNAIYNSEPDTLKKIQAELEACRLDKEKYINLTSEDVVTMTRSAEDYVKRGGKEEDARLTLSIETLETEERLSEEKISLFESQEEELESERESISKAIEQVLPDGILLMLNGASAFYQKDGPSFMAAKDNESERLSISLKRAQNRYVYKKHFEGAQSYVDSLKEGDGEAKLVEQIANLSRKKEAADTGRSLAFEKIEPLEKNLPDIRKAMESIDNAALLAIKKYRSVATVSEDVVNNECEAVLDDPLMQLSKSLKSQTDENNAKFARNDANSVRDYLEDIDIDRKAADLRRTKDGLRNKVSDFINESTRIGSVATGLKPVEAQALKEVKGLEDIPKIRNLYEGILDQHEKSKDMLDKFESSERESRRLVTSRLAHLIDYAATDLNILKSVVGSKRGSHTSYFNVNADVLDKNGIKRLMDGVVAEVDIQEQQRRERKAMGAPGNDDEAYHDSLRATIRETMYKAIFSNPTITYVNTSIRSGGGEHEFNAKLSEGQKAALSLMWAIRLAEFSIEREAKRLSSRRSQQKAREMSTNIMLIDGMFSNLSNRELIDSSMSGIESTRGSFQLIGLIHNPHYQNDFNKFPVLIVGKTEGNGKEGKHQKGWVSFSEENKDEAILKTAQIRHIPKSDI